MKASTSLLRIPTNNCLASQQEGKRMIWCVITWFCMCMFGFSASMLRPYPGSQKGRFSPGARRPRPLGTQPPAPPQLHTHWCTQPVTDEKSAAGTTDAMRLEMLVIYSLWKRLGGRVGGKCVCVCVCAWVRAQWEEENHNSVLWFSWHILSITLSVTWLMGTTESRVNEWPSSHVNPLFQSLSFHEFSAFILPMWWGCYWDRRWVSRKLRGAFLECSTFPQWGILNRRVIMKQVK